MRTESDSLGEIDIKNDKIWGAQTQRSLKFLSSGEEMPKDLVSNYVILKRSMAESNFIHGLISEDVKICIIEACDEILNGKYNDMFPTHIWISGSGTQFHMNINEVISNICCILLNQPLGSKIIHPNDDINKSQSTNDTFPTVMSMAICDNIINLFDELKLLELEFENKENLWNDIVKIGRTHLQDAVPITFGQEFSGYKQLINDHISRLIFSSDELTNVPLGGTGVGTGLNTSESISLLAIYLISQYKLIDFKICKNRFAMQSCHDSFVNFSSLLKGISVTILKIVNDIRLMSSGPRCGIYELIIPSNEPGSSFMPGKVNPTQCEALSMICNQVIANDLAVTLGGSGGILEMNVFKPLIISNILESIKLLTSGISNFRMYLLENLKINQEKLDEYKNNVVIIATVLSPKLGYDLVSELVHESLNNNLTLFDVVVPKYLSRNEYKKIVNLHRMCFPNEINDNYEESNDLKNENAKLNFLDPTIYIGNRFSENQKINLQIVGLTPNIQESLNTAESRVKLQMEGKTYFECFVILRTLYDNDQNLFYYMMRTNPKAYLPIIYDPTIGKACLKYHQFNYKHQGLFISINYKNHIEEILSLYKKNFNNDVRCVCVTNGGRILGLGDLGTNGMPIPIGKLQLYTAIAGVDPKYLLPIFIDVGTDNIELRNDPMYFGIRQNRPQQNDLIDFVDEFMVAINNIYPNVNVHFEDWTGVDAITLLDRYRDNFRCFNDDIQGTASVVLAGIFNACKIKGTSIIDEKILFLGAGSAGIGIANLIVSEMKKEISEIEAINKIRLFNSKGLICKSRNDLQNFHLKFAHDEANCSFEEEILRFKPTMIIGVSTVFGLFTESIIKKMSKINKIPIIFALSNPTNHAECTAEDAYKYSNGKCIYAAGVQFDDVNFNGKILHPDQANNMYIFPAMGMAITTTSVNRVTDEMFIEAAKYLAKLAPNGMLYPPENNIFKTEIAIASHIVSKILNIDFKSASKLVKTNIKNF